MNCPILFFQNINHGIYWYEEACYFTEDSPVFVYSSIIQSGQRQIENEVKISILFRGFIR